MGFDANSFQLPTWEWLDWLFGRHAEKDEPVPFAGDVLRFLTSPISYRFRNRSIVYVIIKNIEFLKTGYDEQYSFDFVISSDPPAPNFIPPLGNRTPSEVVTTSIPYGQEDRGPVLYGYTFTSLNTIAQNQESLREFVRIQLEQRDDEVVAYQNPEDQGIGTKIR